MAGSASDGEALRTFTWMRRIGELPPFQPVVQQTLAALEDGRSSTRDVARILARDESITAAVLRRANSVLYRARGKADTVSQAVTWLGFEHVRSLLIGIALFQQGRLRNPIAESNRKVIWQHSSACARWAVELAVATRYSALEEASLSGLLHDVGKIVIGTSSPGEFAASLELAEAEGITPHEAERRIVGIDHVELGRMVSEHWRFPAIIRSVVELHHAPWPLPIGVTGPDARKLRHLVALVQVADRASRASLFEQPPTGDDAEIRIDIGSEELLERIHEVEALTGS